MYYTVIKHDGHLRTRRKCRKHEPQASVFYISRVSSNVRSVLSQCNTRPRLLHLLYDIEVMWRKTIEHTASMFYTLIKHGFLTNQSARRVLSTLQTYIIIFISFRGSTSFCLLANYVLGRLLRKIGHRKKKKEKEKIAVYFCEV